MYAFLRLMGGQLPFLARDATNIRPIRLRPITKSTIRPWPNTTLGKLPVIGKRMKDDDGFSYVSYKRKKKRDLKQSISPLSSIIKSPSDSLPNFRKIMQNIQVELEQSDFIVHFKEDFHNVLNEWNPGHVITHQDNDFTDLTTSPDSVLAVGKKIPCIDIICYGLGQFFSCFIARYQLGFLLTLKYFLNSIHVYVYDPQFSVEEINFLKELKLNVLAVNEEAKRTLRGKSVCFMPHCDLPLYNNLLWANWNVKGLSDLVIIGNSFQSYKLNDAKGRLKEKAKYVYLVNEFVTEIKMANVFRFSDIFNDLSIHYFKSSSLSLIDSFMWADLEEPEYTDEDEIIKVYK